MAVTISRCHRARSTRCFNESFRRSVTWLAAREFRSASRSSWSPAHCPRSRQRLRRYHRPVRISFRRASAEAMAAFAAAFAFLLVLAPTAPFTHELGVCESGAVRDVLAGNIVLPHFLPGPMVHVPPLYWWTAALGVHALGWTEMALRLPSILASALTCALVYWWAAIAIDRR